MRLRPSHSATSLSANLVVPGLECPAQVAWRHAVPLSFGRHRAGSHSFGGELADGRRAAQVRLPFFGLFFQNGATSPAMMQP